MSLIGAPSRDEVLQKEVEKYEKEIGAQQVKAIRLKMKTDACMTKETELRSNLETAGKELKAWQKAHGGLKSNAAFDKTGIKILKKIEQLNIDIMKTNGECGISKRDMDMANAIEEGMKKALKEFKKKYRLP
jgi:hypothetical protein